MKPPDFTSTLAELRKLPTPSWELDQSERDYYRELGFTSSNVDALLYIASLQYVDLVVDEPDEAQRDAATHAVRILASFQDEEHIPHLIGLSALWYSFDGEQFLSDFFEIMSWYGAAPLEPLLASLGNATFTENVRVMWGETLEKLADVAEKPVRDAIVGGFMSQLGQHRFERTLNGNIIASLVNLEASEALPQIAALYEHHLVNLSVTGDLEEVEVTMGARLGRTSPAPNWFEAEPKELHLALRAKYGPAPESDDPHQVLSYYLKVYGRSPSISSLPELHGYLHGILISAKVSMPSAYFPQIWDRPGREDAYSPPWDSMDEAQAFFSSLMILHNDVIEDLEAGQVEPILSHQAADGTPGRDLAHWLFGLRRGLSVWGGIESLPELATITAEMASMIMFAWSKGEEAEVNELADRVLTMLAYEYQKSIRQSKASFGAGGLGELSEFDQAYEHYQASEPQRREEPKISRNAPCPCGSGKKYKRCCLK